MGADRLNRGDRASGNGGHGNYRREYQREYRSPQQQRNYAEYSGDTQEKVDRRNIKDVQSSQNQEAAVNGTYGNGRNNYTNNEAAVNGTYGNGRNNYTNNEVPLNGTYGNGSRNNGHNVGETVPQSQISLLESRISSVQQEMSQALQDVTNKENEKFDLIFSILTELQLRQTQIEESVRTLKTQFGTINGCGPAPPPPPSPQPQTPSQTSSQQQQFPASASDGLTRANSTRLVGSSAPFVPMNNPLNGQAGQMTGQMQLNAQVNSHINGQAVNQMNSPMTGNYMGAGLSMGPQYGGMDNSQAFFAPVTQVVMMSPTAGMQQMPYVQQVMTPPGPMMPPMAMQFVGPGRGGDDYQWNSNGEALGTARSCNGLCEGPGNESPCGIGSYKDCFGPPDQQQLQGDGRSPRIVDEE